MSDDARHDQAEVDARLAAEWKQRRADDHLRAGDDLAAAYLYQDAARSWTRAGQADRAWAAADQALTRCRALGDPSLILAAYGDVGRAVNTHEHLQQMHRELRTYDAHLHDTAPEAWTVHARNLAQAYLAFGQPRLAVSHFRREYTPAHQARFAAPRFPEDDLEFLHALRTAGFAPEALDLHRRRVERGARRHLRFDHEHGLAALAAGATDEGFERLAHAADAYLFDHVVHLPERLGDSDPVRDFMDAALVLGETERARAHLHLVRPAYAHSLPSPLRHLRAGDLCLWRGDIEAATGGDPAPHWRDAILAYEPAQALAEGESWLRRGEAERRLGDPDAIGSLTYAEDRLRREGHLERAGVARRARGEAKLAAGDRAGAHADFLASSMRAKAAGNLTGHLLDAVRATGISPGIG